MKKATRKALLTAKTYRPGKAGGGSRMLMPGDPQREANLAAMLKGNHALVPKFLYHGQNPRTVEHHSLKDGKWTSVIDHEATAQNIDAQGFSAFRPSESGNYGPGVYLIDSPKVASDYAQGVRAGYREAMPVGNVLKLHVSMKQPFHDGILKDPKWKERIKQVLTPKFGGFSEQEQAARKSLFEKLDNGTATVRDVFLSDTPNGPILNQFGQHDLLGTIRRSGFDGIIAPRPDGSREFVAFDPKQVKSATGNQGTFDPNEDDINKAAGGRTGYQDGGMPELKTDNPGGEWLQNKIEDAQSRCQSARPDTYEATLGTGSGVTGWFNGNYELPVDLLKDLPGAMGEEKFRDTGPKLKSLKESIAEHGYKPAAILVHVREDGQPFIVEGNHRVAEAVQSGRKTIPGEIKYLRGSEDIDGPLHPSKVLAALKSRNNYSDGGDVEDNDQEYDPSNQDVIQTTQRLGTDTSSIPALQETKKLMQYHRNFMGDISSRAAAMGQQIKALREQGELPLEVGDRFHTYSTKAKNQPPFKVLGYYVDSKNPDKSYGYHVRQELGDGDYQETRLAVRDPRLEALHGPEKWAQLTQHFPLGKLSVVKRRGGSVVDKAMSLARSLKRP